ncbi:periplasmic heavy metal sensor [Belnapia sp. T6]|uniref:Periplasmic heavy metal sensor n=1 Tax=Belnapia mucosa TaxID=2804532 RepID=A0ABS1V583_9PROT|nr:periplasmic heavy metal sensor [Belnapia mucosa]MBL6456834.1 periplasmic heavy metal sensor [Belnapia mucosa]
MRRPSGRSLLAATLGASLVMNAVLAGLLWWRPVPPARSGRGFDRMVGRIEAVLPEADRPRFREVLGSERERYASQLAAMRAASAEVDAMMRRDPYDPEALRRAFDQWAERVTAFNRAFSDTLVDALGAVSPEGRAQIAAARRPGG